MARPILCAAIFFFLFFLPLSGQGQELRSVGTHDPETDPMNRPVLLTTDPMLAIARKRVEQNAQPASTAWEKIRELSENALSREFMPYQEGEYKRYYRTARDQARAVRDLAIAFHMSGDERFQRRAVEILIDWSDEFHRHFDFPNLYPASEIPHASGLVIGRTVTIFADAYALLYPSLDETDRQKIESWFQKLVPPIKESLRLWETGEYLSFQPPFFDRQYFNNHLGACTMGIAAIGFALRDPDLIEYAIGQESERTRDYGEVEEFNLRDLYALVNGVIFMPGDFGSGEEGDVWSHGRQDPSLHGAPPPLPGEIYDRYRVLGGNGTHYALLHLRLLTLMAEMTRNNLGTPHYGGPDFYQYTGNRGENLRVSYELYAEWFITRDPASVNDGYYVDWIANGNKPKTIEGDLNALALYELVRLRYPESERIAAALQASGEAGDRPAFDPETFGWTAALLYGHTEIEEE